MKKIEVGNIFKDSLGEFLEVVKISKLANVLTCKDSKGTLIKFTWVRYCCRYIELPNYSRELLTIQEGF
jgi:hypothetical protein